MNSFDIASAEYAVSGLDGFSLTEALSLWKTKFESFPQFERAAITHPGLYAFGRFVEEVWNEIQPIAIEQALREANIERRRVMFDCIGVARIFQSLEPELLDKQVLQKKRVRWNEWNQSYDITYEDTYELYRIEGKKMFSGTDEPARTLSIYAVRCWCTTTSREYWIYVPEEAALGPDVRYNPASASPDAIRSIAWTIRIDISFPKRIFRQGDIIIAEESEQSVDVAPYHLSKDDYLNLMYSET